MYRGLMGQFFWLLLKGPMELSYSEPMCLFGFYTEVPTTVTKYGTLPTSSCFKDAPLLAPEPCFMLFTCGALLLNPGWAVTHA